MPVADSPSLRPFLAAVQDRSDPRYVVVWDRLGLAGTVVRMTLDEFRWVQLLDGRRSLVDIQAEAVRQAQGRPLSLGGFAALVERLDEALFLNTPRFQDKVSGPVREPSCIGCYEGEPEALRRQLRGLFTAERGPGLPGARPRDGGLRAALLPHIDYHRGGASYAWGFKELFERSDASLFVIIGTAHYSGHRFTLTRKNFKTPLGIVPTDQQYIDRLVACYGNGLFDDPLAHLPEHSIELEVVVLQFLYEAQRPIRIVPLLVGPFQDCVAEHQPPQGRGDIERMIRALRQAEQESAEPICYIISGDLAHIGPKFGDPELVREPFLSRSREQDQALVSRLENGDVDRYFETIAAEGDSRRICGLPPTYTLLKAIEPARGKLLDYDQYVHPRGYESVSFASMAFYR
jgi:AmmeMemoRadiSam system protein B